MSNGSQTKTYGSAQIPEGFFIITVKPPYTGAVLDCVVSRYPRGFKEIKINLRTGVSKIFLRGNPIAVSILTYVSLKDKMKTKCYRLEEVTQEEWEAQYESTS
jgi:hypothetical protein